VKYREITRSAPKSLDLVLLVKNVDCVDGFGSTLLSSFSMSAFYYFLKYLRSVVGLGLGDPRQDQTGGPSDDVIMFSQS